MILRTGRAKGRTYVTASAGNHGMSVAAGASAFGASAVVYIAESVPEVFADRLRGLGAQVVREGAIYEDSSNGLQALRCLGGRELAAMAGAVAAARHHRHSGGD